jgi:hypothetical protein
MATGFASLPAIALGLDDAASAPGWAWVGSTSWAGGLAFIGWCFWLARTLSRASRGPGRAVVGGAP